MTVASGRNLQHKNIIYSNLRIVFRLFLLYELFQSFFRVLVKPPNGSLDFLHFGSLTIFFMLNRVFKERYFFQILLYIFFHASNIFLEFCLPLQN